MVHILGKKNVQWWKYPLNCVCVFKSYMIDAQRWGGGVRKDTENAFNPLPFRLVTAALLHVLRIHAHHASHFFLRSGSSLIREPLCTKVNLSFMDGTGAASFECVGWGYDSRDWSWSLIELIFFINKHFSFFTHLLQPRDHEFMHFPGLLAIVYLFVGTESLSQI